MFAAMIVHGMLDFEHIKVVGIKNKYLGDTEAVTLAGIPYGCGTERVDPTPPVERIVLVRALTMETYMAEHHLH